jgi:hypothetical protein
VNPAGQVTGVVASQEGGQASNILYGGGVISQSPGPENGVHPNRLWGAFQGRGARQADDRLATGKVSAATARAYRTPLASGDDDAAAAACFQARKQVLQAEEHADHSLKRLAEMLRRVERQRRAQRLEVEVVAVDVQPLPLSMAVLGGKISVPTPTGPVQMTVPKWTTSGAVLRLKGKGPPRRTADAAMNMSP